MIEVRRVDLGFQIVLYPTRRRTSGSPAIDEVRASQQGARECDFIGLEYAGNRKNHVSCQSWKAGPGWGDVLDAALEHSSGAASTRRARLTSAFGIQRMAPGCDNRPAYCARIVPFAL